MKDKTAAGGAENAGKKLKKAFLANAAKFAKITNLSNLFAGDDEESGEDYEPCTVTKLRKFKCFCPATGSSGTSSAVC